MPLTGLLSFLRIKQDSTGTAMDCVNALKRASFISTIWQLCEEDEEASVNALNRASFISTVQRVNQQLGIESVNALNRASFISTS